MTQPGDRQRALLAILQVQAARDPEFRARLLADPGPVLAAQGVELPPGVELRVVEDTASVRHLVLPPAQESATLSEEQLAGLSGGAGVVTDSVETLAVVGGVVEVGAVIDGQAVVVSAIDVQVDAQVSSNALVYVV